MLCLEAIFKRLSALKLLVIACQGSKLKGVMHWLAGDDGPFPFQVKVSDLCARGKTLGCGMLRGESGLREAANFLWCLS